MNQRAQSHESQHCIKTWEDDISKGQVKFKWKGDRQCIEADKKGGVFRKTGIMKNELTSLFHQQNHANQQLMPIACKMPKETIMQDSLTSYSDGMFS